MAKKNVSDFPEEFSTSQHSYERTEGSDGRQYFFKDGQFTSSRSYKNAYYHAFMEIDIPTGETVTVRRDIASEAGMVAHEPREGETFTIEDIDGNLHEVAESEFSQLVSDLYDEGIDPIRYKSRM